MAVKIGSVLSVKMRRAQDPMAALDKRIQKKTALLEALARAASTAPAVDGTGKEVGFGRKGSGTSTGWKQDRTGQHVAWGSSNSALNLGGSEIARGAFKLGGSKIPRGAFKLDGSKIAQGASIHGGSAF